MTAKKQKKPNPCTFLCISLIITLFFFPYSGGLLYNIIIVVSGFCVAYAIFYALSHKKGESKETYIAPQSQSFTSETSPQTVTSETSPETQNSQTITFCPFCGVRVENDQKFCQNCGSEVNS